MSNEQSDPSPQESDPAKAIVSARASNGAQQASDLASAPVQQQPKAETKRSSLYRDALLLLAGALIGTLQGTVTEISKNLSDTDKFVYAKRIDSIREYSSSSNRAFFRYRDAFNRIDGTLQRTLDAIDNDTFGQSRQTLLDEWQRAGADLENAGKEYLESIHTNTIMLYAFFEGEKPDLDVEDALNKAEQRVSELFRQLDANLKSAQTRSEYKQAARQGFIAIREVLLEVRRDMLGRQDKINRELLELAARAKP